jgi:hypothetical protein
MNMALVHSEWGMVIQKTVNIRKDWLMAEAKNEYPDINFNFDHPSVFIQIHPLGCAFAVMLTHSLAKPKITKKNYADNYASFDVFWSQNTLNSVAVTGHMQNLIKFSVSMDNGGKLHHSRIKQREGKFYTTLIASSEGIKPLRHEIMVGYSTYQPHPQIVIKQFPVFDPVLKQNHMIFMSWKSETHTL